MARELPFRETVKLATDPACCYSWHTRVVPTPNSRLLGGVVASLSLNIPFCIIQLSVGPASQLLEDYMNHDTRSLVTTQEEI